MALVFWKPSDKGALSSTLKELFEEISFQDQQTSRWSITPFFVPEKVFGKKIVFVSDFSNRIPSIESYLNHIQSAVYEFEKALHPSSSHVFFSLRDQNAASRLLTFSDQTLTSGHSSYKSIQIPLPPLPKPSMNATFGMRLNILDQGSLNSRTHISSSWIKQAVYWPEIFSEADLIIPINYFHSSCTFTIHGTLSSLFYCMPSASQSMILVQSNPQKRSQYYIECLRTILSKVLFAVLLSCHDPAFALISNDYLAADAFSTALGSIRALSVPLNRYANKQKLGVGDITKINLIGPKFIRPLYPLEGYLGISQKNTLECNQSNCISCNQCMNTCPMAAWEKCNNFYHWQMNKCNHCGHCVDICPVNAIHIF